MRALRLNIALLLFLTGSRAIGMTIECQVLMEVLSGRLPSQVGPTVVQVFGAQANPSMARLAQTTGLMLRLDSLIESADKFSASLPSGKLTPSIIEEKIAPFSNEFAMLPSRDTAELVRVQQTNVALAALLSDPTLPPGLRTRLVHYQNTVTRLGLEPGLPFSQIVKDVSQLSRH